MMQPHEFESELKDVLRYPFMLYELIAKAYHWHFEGAGNDAIRFFQRALEFQEEYAQRSLTILSQAQALSWPEDVRIITMVVDLDKLRAMLRVLASVLENSESRV